MRRALLLTISFAGFAGMAWAQDEPARLTSRSLAPAPSTRALPAAPTVHKLSIGPIAAPIGEVVTQPAATADTTTEALLERAKSGDPESNYRLGLRHLSGEGAKRDLVEAFARIRLAAEAGHARAISLFYAIGAKLTADEHAQAYERSQKLRTESRAAR